MEYSNYLVHHGILGQKWGVRRYQNPDGTLTDAGKRRNNRIVKSGNARLILKNKSKLSDEEFHEAYKNAKETDDLKKMAYGDRSVAKEIAISAGKEFTKTAVKTAFVVGTVAYLTKTESGRKLVSNGRKAVINMLKEAGESAIKNTSNVAKDVVNNAKDSVKTAAREAKNRDVTAFNNAVKNGNVAAKTLKTYGQTVDKIIRKR